jgi:DNA-nicking Smr family endonuclease
MSGRRLSDEERTLWKGVTRAIKPLRPRRDKAADDTVTPEQPKASGRPRPAATFPAATAPRRTAPPGPAPLGRRFKQRVARGTEAIEGRIDLHGMTQAEAHAALLRFLRSSQRRGARTVLVITGKGARTADDRPSERGVLKRQVPMWLRLPEFRGLIVGYEDAAVRHGGEGALYVRLRRLDND